MDAVRLRGVVRNIGYVGATLVYASIGLVAAMSMASVDSSIRLTWILFAVALGILGTMLRVTAHVLIALADRILDAAEEPPAA